MHSTLFSHKHARRYTTEQKKAGTVGDSNDLAKDYSCE